MAHLSHGKEALNEHHFWLQALGDHARFIYNALSSAEAKEVEQALQFIKLSDNLWEQSLRIQSDQEIEALNKMAYHLAVGLRTFKLNLLRRQLAGQIRIGLSPGFLNHMVNETEKYLQTLNCFLAGESPASPEPLHYSLLWLGDAAIHAEAIAHALDGIEKSLLKRSHDFNHVFNELYRKAEEITGFTRTSLRMFPALAHLNRQVVEQINLFLDFLKELKNLALEKKVLGTLDPLLLDHMGREACYFLTKLSSAAGANQPNCDPGKPRVHFVYE